MGIAIVGAKRKALKNLQRTTYFLLSAIGITIVLYYGRAFLIPISFGALFAMLFTPLSRWLQARRIPKLLAILTCVFILILGVSLFMGALLWQGSELAQDWPEIEKKVIEHGTDIRSWAVERVSFISEERIDRFYQELASEQETYRRWITNSMDSLFGSITQSVLSVIYMIFLMMAEERITRFGQMVGRTSKVDAAMKDARNLVHQYFIGRLILVAIQAVIFATGFLIFGLQYAIPVGILAGVFTFIPYIGNIIGGLLALMIGLATGGSPILFIGILGTITLSQILENNVLQPWIVGKEVNLNPFFTFVCIIGFTTIWGIAGTILAIPITAIAKTMFDYSKSMRPYGYLMGLRDDYQ